MPDAQIVPTWKTWSPTILSRQVANLTVRCGGVAFRYLRC
jgi:hypothetical protein